MSTHQMQDPPFPRSKSWWGRKPFFLTMTAVLCAAITMYQIALVVSKAPSEIATSRKKTPYEDAMSKEDSTSNESELDNERHHEVQANIVPPPSTVEDSESNKSNLDNGSHEEDHTLNEREAGKQQEHEQIQAANKEETRPVVEVSYPSYPTKTTHKLQTTDKKKKDREFFFRAHVLSLGGPMCIGTDRTIIFVANKEHEDALRFTLTTLDAANYTFPENMFTSLQHLPKKIRTTTKDNVLFWRQDSRTYSSLGETKDDLAELPPPSPLINSSALLLDNGVGAYQFGHTLNLYIPLITLLEAGQLDSFSHFVDFLYRPKEENPRWSSRIVDSLIDDVVLKSNLAKERSNLSPSFQLRKPELNSGQLEVTCFAHAAVFRAPERYFENTIDVELFYDAVHKAYPSFQPSMDSCPPQKAIVIYRSGEGAGLRRVLNYDAIEQALRDNGITEYTNETLNQDTPIEDAMELFSSAGLIISTHSSALKMVAFAHPGTVVVELRPTDMEGLKGMDPSVFGKGPDVMGIHYISHNKHQAKYDTCIQRNCAEKGYVYSDLHVNRNELSSAIREGLEQQAKRCPIWE